MGLEIEGLSFELLVNSASLLAILVIYRKDLHRLATNGFNYLISRDPDLKADFMFIVYLIIVAIAGILLEDYLFHLL